MDGHENNFLSKLSTSIRIQPQNYHIFIHKRYPSILFWLLYILMEYAMRL